MKRNILLIMVAALFLAGSAVSAYALPVGLGFDGTGADEVGIAGTWSSDYKGYYSSTEQWSGYYIGSSSGPANQEPLESLAALYLGLESFDGTWDKFDVDENTNENGYLTIEIDDDGLSGTWTLSSPYELGFYAVKGATDFALYYVVDPFQSTGNWSTIHLVNGGGNQPEISHLGALVETAPIPEPATMILFGTGLLALAGAGRKKFMKR